MSFLPVSKRSDLINRIPTQAQMLDQTTYNETNELLELIIYELKEIDVNSENNRELHYEVTVLGEYSPEVRKEVCNAFGIKNWTKIEHFNLTGKCQFRFYK